MSEDIADSENCSLWITHLPRDCDVHMLLGAVRNCGKVYQTHVNPPELETDHLGCAAKLVFFQHAPAAKLMRLSREGNFPVGNCQPHVHWNRTRVSARPETRASRVLAISGPAALVDRQNLEPIFGGCQYVMDMIEGPNPVGGSDMVEMVWHFGSYRCQAEWCEKALRAARKDTMAAYGVGDRGATPDNGRNTMGLMWKRVRIHWGVDPCAMP